MLSPVDEIKAKLNILDIVQAYIQVQKAGNNYRALCPFHNEKTPSLFISPDKQVWHCFGCGKGGSIFQFVMEIEGIDFSEALRMLAQKAGVELKKYDKNFYTKRSKILEINQIALNFYVNALYNTKGGEAALTYLINRGLSEETIKDFQIGYAPNNWRALTYLLKKRKIADKDIIISGFGIKSPNKNGDLIDRFRGRIMFPIFSANDEIIAFSGRILPQLEIKKDGTKEAKYVNTPNTVLYEKSATLYNLNKARDFIKKEKFAILVEGNLDMILSYQAGIKNVIAPCGTALTLDHLKILKRYVQKLYLAFDSDEAGIEAAKRAVQLCVANDVSVKLILITEGKDPADLIKKNPSLWSLAVEQAVDAIEFYFNIAAKKFPDDNLDNKKKIIEDLAWFINAIKNPIDKSYWIKILSEKINLPQEAISDMIEFYGENKAQVLRIEEKISSSNLKTIKRSNIEDNVISIFLKYTDLLRKWKDVLNGDSLFKDHLNKKILSCLINNLPCDDVKDDINRFLLRAEYLFPDKFLAEKELSLAIVHLQKRNLKEKVKEISAKIKEAEKKGDQEAVFNLQDILNKILKNNKI